MLLTIALPITEPNCHTGKAAIDWGFAGLLVFPMIVYRVRRKEPFLVDFQGSLDPCINLVIALFRPVLEHGELPVLVRN